ncbi:hypothetical protein ACKWTF_012577 [Chironomus riparius]
MRFYKIECPADNDTQYLEKISCKLSSQKQGTASLSAVADLILPVTSVNINFLIIYRSLNKIMLNVTFDYCSSYNNLPPYIRIIFDMYKKHSNDLIHECPYETKKRIGIENFPLEVHTAVLAVVNFQRGDYKSILDIRDRKGNLIVYFNCYLSVSQRKNPRNGRKS